MLRLNQNIKPCHEHHVYVLLHVVKEKLNFNALILKLSSNLFLGLINNYFMVYFFKEVVKHNIKKMEIQFSI